MRSLIFVVLLLTWLPATSQKFAVTWLDGITLPDSLNVRTLSADQAMTRICLMTFGPTNRYVYIAEKNEAGTWTAPYLALTIRSFAMHARISADGNRIYMMKEMDEINGVSRKEVSPGVIHSTNKMSIYVSEQIETKKWTKPTLLDDLFIFDSPINSLSVSPDESNLIFSYAGLLKSDKPDFSLYRSEKTKQNKWGDPRRVVPKGITLVERPKKGMIRAAAVQHQDKDRILISTLDGEYIAQYDGSTYAMPTKLDYFANSIEWISQDGSVALIQPAQKPLRIGMVQLKAVTQNPMAATRVASGTPQVVDSAKVVKPLGKYYAVLIGVSDYKNPSLNLDRPAKDVAELKNLLLSDYTFEDGDIQTLINPTRQQIIATLFKLRQTINRNDNLLIFYAGHGHYDKKIEQGYWWPQDAVPDDPSNWLSNSDLREQIRGINSAHTLLISDACFSGGIFKMRGAGEGGIAPMEVMMLYRTRSRRAITSGNMSSVPDRSVFFEYLTKRLNENPDQYLSSQQLFEQLRTPVINNSLNVPLDGVIAETGDEGGDFIFIRK